MNRQIASVIKVARAELGNTEFPKGSNNTKYGADYGLQGQPWCVIFLWWIFRAAGLARLFFDGKKTASCGSLLRWAKGAGRIVSLSDLRAGDILLLAFTGTEAQHCALVVEVERKMKYGMPSFIHTIEGNTTPGEEGSQDNGGSVALKLRFTSQVVAVIRPAYEEVGEMDYSGHWAEDNINWAFDVGLVKGYADGDRIFKPDQTMTRAEVVTMLRRYDELRNGGKKDERS